MRGVTHNSNSTDELVAFDPKSTIIRIKIVFEDYKTGSQFFIKYTAKGIRGLIALTKG